MIYHASTFHSVSEDNDTTNHLKILVLYGNGSTERVYEDKAIIEPGFDSAKNEDPDHIWFLYSDVNFLKNGDLQAKYKIL